MWDLWQGDFDLTYKTPPTFHSAIFVDYLCIKSKTNEREKSERILLVALDRIFFLMFTL